MRTASAAADEIRKLSHSAIVKIADVSKFESVISAVEEVGHEFGKIGVLVNNAGVEKRAPFLEITAGTARTAGMQLI